MFIRYKNYVISTDKVTNIMIDSDNNFAEIYFVNDEAATIMDFANSKDLEQFIKTVIEYGY